MLPAAARLRRRAEFAAVLRAGTRGGTPSVVVHAAPGPDPAGPTRVGFIVSRSVGPAVVRNRVRRRLRQLLAQRLTSLPAGLLLVVRVRPPAAHRAFAVLSSDLDRALQRCGLDTRGAVVRA